MNFVRGAGEPCLYALNETRSSDWDIATANIISGMKLNMIMTTQCHNLASTFGKSSAYQWIIGARIIYTWIVWKFLRWEKSTFIDLGIGYTALASLSFEWLPKSNPIIIVGAFQIASTSSSWPNVPHIKLIHLHLAPISSNVQWQIFCFVFYTNDIGRGRIRHKTSWVGVTIFNHLNYKPFALSDKIRVWNCWEYLILIYLKLHALSSRLNLYTLGRVGFSHRSWLEPSSLVLAHSTTADLKAHRINLGWVKPKFMPLLLFEWQKLTGAISFKYWAEKNKKANLCRESFSRFCSHLVWVCEKQARKWTRPEREGESHHQ